MDKVKMRAADWKENAGEDDNIEAIWILMMSCDYHGLDFVAELERMYNAAAQTRRQYYQYSAYWMQPKDDTLETASVWNPSHRYRAPTCLLGLDLACGDWGVDSQLW
jgi:hypothetical protein